MEMYIEMQQDLEMETAQVSVSYSPSHGSPVVQSFTSSNEAKFLLMVVVILH